MDTRLSGELERALARIPERQRSALLLAEVHELSGVELAATLGTSHIAARALLTRARESLRRALADERLLAAAAEAAGRPLERPATGGSRPEGHR
jgi:RNA polymerase sigma-70 factor (ECF subfamily)